MEDELSGKLQNSVILKAADLEERSNRTFISAKIELENIQSLRTKLSEKHKGLQMLYDDNVLHELNITRTRYNEMNDEFDSIMCEKVPTNIVSESISSLYNQKICKFASYFSSRISQLSEDYSKVEESLLEKANISRSLKAKFDLINRDLVERRSYYLEIAGHLKSNLREIQSNFFLNGIIQRGGDQMNGEKLVDRRRKILAHLKKIYNALESAESRIDEIINLERKLKKCEQSILGIQGSDN